MGETNASEEQLAIVIGFAEAVKFRSSGIGTESGRDLENIDGYNGDSLRFQVV